MECPTKRLKIIADTGPSSTMDARATPTISNLDPMSFPLPPNRQQYTIFLPPLQFPARAPDYDTLAPGYMNRACRVPYRAPIPRRMRNPRRRDQVQQGNRTYKMPTATSMQTYYPPIH